MDEWVLPDWPAPATVRAMQTTRRGGCSVAPWDSLNLGDHVGDDPSHVLANRARLRSRLPGEPAWLKQVHGTRVVEAMPDVSPVIEADAAFARQSGAVCVVMTADCLPVLFCDRAGTVVGAAHAGWRGLAAGVLENTVAAMRARGAADILAWLGPAIGPDNFEVGAEVKEAFVQQQAGAQAAFRDYPGRPGKHLADIYQLARLRLAAVGVDQISGGGLCTVADTRFYSYRRDRVTGRMGSLIWLK